MNPEEFRGGVFQVNGHGRKDGIVSEESLQKQQQKEYQSSSLFYCRIEKYAIILKDCPVCRPRLSSTPYANESP